MLPASMEVARLNSPLGFSIFFADSFTDTITQPYGKFMTTWHGDHRQKIRYEPTSERDFYLPSVVGKDK